MRNKVINRVMSVLRTKGCCKIKSIYYSLKWGGVIIVYPKTRVKISKSAHLNITGKLIINKSWTCKQMFPSLFYMADNSKLNVSGTFAFYNGCQVEVTSGAELVLGSGYINGHGKIVCTSFIEIGEGVAIADDVFIQDSEFHSIVREGFKVLDSVKIGDHTWIGIRSTILKGVSIGDGSIIAAGSMVNKSVPPKVLAAGIPARIVRENVEWEK